MIHFKKGRSGISDLQMTGDVTSRRFLLSLIDGVVGEKLPAECPTGRKPDLL